MYTQGRSPTYLPFSKFGDRFFYVHSRADLFLKLGRFIDSCPSWWICCHFCVMAAVAELFGWVFSLFDYLDDLRNLINEFIG